MRKALHNSFLQTDMGGGEGFSAGTITEPLGGSVVGYKTVREVSIGIRTSGKTGSGSYDDPWAANTAAQFDAIMTDVTKAFRANTIIRVRDGEFLHSGQNVWSLKAGCVMVGEGIGVTTLKLDADTVVSVNGLNCIHSDPSVDNGIYVSDLTIDTNFDALQDTPLGWLNGVALYGNNCRVERVRVTGGFGIFQVYESFGIACFGVIGSTVPTYGQKVKDCIVDDSRGTYDVGIGVAGAYDTGGNLATGSVVSGCRVTGYRVPDITVFDASHSVGIGVGGGVVENCEISDCQVGIYVENGHDIQIRNNTLKDILEMGIHINPAGTSLTPDDENWIKRPSIIGNSIELRDDVQRRWGIVLADQDDNQREIHNATIVGNTVYEKLTGAGIPDAFGSAYLISGALTGRGHIIIGNHFDGTLDNTPSLQPDALSFGNRDLDGTMLTLCPDQIGESAVVSDDFFKAAWNGDTMVAPSKNAVYDRIIALEQTTSFTPLNGINDGDGGRWYRLITGAGEMSGNVRIRASYDSKLDDLEFFFSVSGYGVGTAQHVINILRNTFYNRGHIDQIRVSSSTGNAAYLDIHVLTPTAASQMNIYVSGPGIPTLATISTTAAVVGDRDNAVMDVRQGLLSSWAVGLGDHALPSSDSIYDGQLMRDESGDLWWGKSGGFLLLNEAPTAPDTPLIFVDAASGDDATAERLVYDPPFETIQAALDAAVDGDEIIIKRGTYNEEVIVKAGTYVITLQHGAIWTQTLDAACLKSAAVTCDITVNGDMFTDDDGCACVAMLSGHSGCTFRINGKMTQGGTGSVYGEPSGAVHNDGTLYIKGDIFAIGSGTKGIYSLNAAATAVLVVEDCTIDCEDQAAVVFVGPNGTATFTNCVLASSSGLEAIRTEDRDLDFTGCTLRAVDSASAIYSSGTATVTLRNYCHLISGSLATELSSGPLAAIVLDGYSFTDKPKEAGTSLTGDGYLHLNTAAATQDTGWGAMTGTPVKTTIAAAAAGTASVGYVQAELQAALNRIAAAEARMKGYDDMLIAAGFIGA